MPQLTPYSLTFQAGLHLGVNLEDSVTQLPADTLFAALVDVWRRNGRDPARLVAGFATEPADPPFLLTSAFPFAGDVRFFPMPVDLTRLFTGETLQKHNKLVKRIRYFSEALLTRCLAGERLDDWLFPDAEHETPRQGVALQGGALWLTTQEAEALPDSMRLKDAAAKGTRPLHALRQLAVFANGRVPRVTIDRINSASTIYHAGRTTFAQGCGLWFGVQWRRPQAAADGAGMNWHALFDQSMALLADDGLGGERSSGYGGFRFAVGAPLHLPDAQPGRPTLLLSRYHPTAGELPAALTDPAAAYLLTRVMGWLRSPDAAGQRRKQLLLVREGSIVCPPRTLAGDVVDVRPDYAAGAGVSHPVYRYGLALSVDAAKLRGASHA